MPGMNPPQTTLTFRQTYGSGLLSCPRAGDTNAPGIVTATTKRRIDLYIFPRFAFSKRLLKDSSNVDTQANEMHLCRRLPINQARGSWRGARVMKLEEAKTLPRSHQRRIAAVNVSTK